MKSLDAFESVLPVEMDLKSVVRNPVIDQLPFRKGPDGHVDLAPLWRRVDRESTYLAALEGKEPQSFFRSTPTTGRSLVIPLKWSSPGVRTNSGQIEINPDERNRFTVIFIKGTGTPLGAIGNTARPWRGR